MVNNKLLIALSALGSHQASATESTNDAIHQILDYCATYPDDVILYQSSNMILAAHSDAGFDLVALNHPAPKKPQLSPHRCREIKYGSKFQHAHEEDTSTPLDHSGIRRVQQIVGALLWVGRAVNNKLHVALSAIGSQQASATESKNDAIHQLLDYCATYPDDGIIYRSSDMILAAHSDAEFANELFKAR